MSITKSSKSKYPHFFVGSSNDSISTSLPSFSQLFDVLKMNDTQEGQNADCKQSSLPLPFKDIHGVPHISKLENSTVPSYHDSSIFVKDSSLQTLAKIGGSNYYSSDKPSDAKEREVLKYLLRFLKTRRSLDECFEKMGEQLELYKVKDLGQVSPENLLVIQGSDSPPYAILRENFMHWMSEIPDIMYISIDETLVTLRKCFYELRIMKSNFLLKNFNFEVQSQNVYKTFDRELKEEKCDAKNKFMCSSIDRIGNHRSKFTQNFKRLTKNKPKRHKFSKIVSQKGIFRCKHCGTEDTPEWRRGPDGARTLCNACGLFFSKLSKRFGVDKGVLIMKNRKNSSLTEDRTVPSINSFMFKI